MANPTTLTLTGPTSVAPGTDVLFHGVLTGVDDTGQVVPLPSRKLRLSIDDVPVAYPVTDSGGAFQVSLKFPDSGLHSLKAEYLAAGATGFPPPNGYCTRDGDAVMRTCLSVDPVTGAELRKDVFTYVCSAGVWVPTGDVCLEGYNVEPCNCYDGDNEYHQCALGDDRGYVARFWCTGDAWSPIPDYCTPSESPEGICTLCDTYWVDCEGYVQPERTCDANGNWVTVNLPCPRPSPSYTLVESNFPDPISPTYQIFPRQELSKLGSLHAFSVSLMGGNGVCLYDSVSKVYKFFLYPSKSADGLITYAPVGLALVAPDVVWVLESVRLWTTGAVPTPRLVKLRLSGTTGTILEEHPLGSPTVGRAGTIIKLESGAVVASWYDYLVQAEFETGLAYVSPTGVFSMLPVTVPAQGGLYPGTMPPAYFAIGQHPVDGSVWMFYHRDSFHNISMVRAIESGGTLSILSVIENYVASGAVFPVYGELPRLSCLVNAARGKLYLCYPTTPDAICCRNDDGTKTSLFRLAILDLSTSGGFTGKATRPYVPWNSAWGITHSASGEPWMICFPPIKVTGNLPHVVVPDSLGWETVPVPIGETLRATGYYNAGFAVGSDAMVLLLADGRFHFYTLG